MLFLLSMVPSLYIAWIGACFMDAKNGNDIIGSMKGCHYYWRKGLFVFL